MTAGAVDFSLADGVEGKLTGTASFGTMIRAESPQPSSYPYIASQVVAGVPAGNLYGLTASPDLNYQKNKPVSTVLKGLVDLDIHAGSLGVFARAYGWYDFTLGHQSAAYGNYPNGFSGGALSDNGFAPEAQFSNVLMRDVYVYDRFKLGEASTLNLRLGRQMLNWGTSQFFTGGINSAINPVDYAAQLRPGALPEESRLPVGMLSANLAAGKQWGVDGFVEYEFRSAVAPGCGTFFDFSSVSAQGCNMAGLISRPIPAAFASPAFGAAAAVLAPLTTVSGISEPGLLKDGFYLRRSPDAPARNSGQFGLSLSYKAASIGTEFRGYAMKTHSTTPSLRVYVGNSGNAPSTIAGVDLGVLGGASGALLGQELNRINSANYAATYGTTYAEDVRLFGGSFDTRLDPTLRLFGEVAYRPNQPISWNGSDLTLGALQRISLSNSGVPAQVINTVLATPVGGSFDAFDRFRVTTFNLGINKVVPKALGAERVILAGELGTSHVAGLPDPNVMRYGRSFTYGSAPVMQANGTYTTCSEAMGALVPSGVPGKTCTTSGFVTTHSWGLRGRISASYPSALLGAMLTPSLYLAADIQGYSYDGTYSAGRRTVAPGLRADWVRGYFAEMRYTRFFGGAYNLFDDKSNVTLVAGVKF